MIAARVVGVIQVGTGLAMLLDPARVAHLAAGRGSVAPLPIVRFLGLRLAGQGALTVAHPSRSGLEVGAGVDGIHLASMVALAVVAPKYRQTALVSAAMAAASLGGSLGARG